MLRYWRLQLERQSQLQLERQSQLEQLHQQETELRQLVRGGAGSQLQLVAKRSPGCLLACLRHQVLHPAQCHSYCTAG